MIKVGLLIVGLIPFPFYKKLVQTTTPLYSIEENKYIINKKVKNIFKMSEKSSTEDLSQIPMADEEIDSDEHAERNNLSTSNSTPRSSNGLQSLNGLGHDNLDLSPPTSLLDHDLTQEEQEEKARLIAQVT